MTHFSFVRSRMSAIILATLNARYTHASLGLRYLAANMGELAADTQIIEFVLQQKAEEIVETLLATRPVIIGLGVYIWNIDEMTRVVGLLKRVSPETVVVLGGPEVSYECNEQQIVHYADYVITGWGDISFPHLCREIFNKNKILQKIIPGIQPALADIKLPYEFYSDTDIKQRTLYVEASRGCPFKCEFCLSSLDKTAWAFDLDRFLDEMAKLYDRGARLFKFVDRTFNLNIKASARILEFFLERMDENLFVHFEVIPDHLPDKLKELIVKFPPGSLQFEIGIQTFNPEVQQLISRKQDTAKSETNIRWLANESQAHMHVDLIIGLPGEDMESFAKGFNQLWALNPHEIQVGVLKRLRGTPIIRHTEAHDMRYSPFAPYTILSTDCIDFPTMQRLNRFARYWDLVANSGRFKQSLHLLLGDSPFERFMQFSDWLFATTRKTHQIALDRLFELNYKALLEVFEVPKAEARAALEIDFKNTGAKEAPAFLKEDRESAKKEKSSKLSHRQQRHLNS